MLVNPLFDKDDERTSPKKDEAYVFQHRKGKTIQPVSKDLQAPPHARPTPLAHSHPAQQHAKAHSSNKEASQSTPAVELIRKKVAALYTEEPDIKEELAEIVKPAVPLSKHQLFMQQLSSSGKSLSQIQTEWHEYYTSLPDQEKHEVWQEFYQNNGQQPSAYAAHAAAANNKSETITYTKGRRKHPKAIVSQHQQLPAVDYQTRKDRRSGKRIKRQILDKVAASANTQAKAKEHLRSLAFGISTGLIVLVIFLFGFFNEMVIAPFIQPSRHVSATPIIVNADSAVASDIPEVLIPKINVQIPVVYGLGSIKEEVVQKGLEDGVVHYSTTTLPGQAGNSAIFGHSSNNIFNKGKYKFAFVKLHELVPGDVFHLTYDKKVYSYRVFDKKVVPPTEVAVLGPVQGKVATATLITCDPPGTATNRLVVWGEQISPDPAGAVAPSEPIDQNSTPTELPSEGPTLWTRLWRSIF